MPAAERRAVSVHAAIPTNCSAALEPITVAYEDLGTDPYGTVREIAHRAGETIEPPDVNLAAPLRIQTDDVSAAWKQRFLDEYRNLDVLEAL